MRHTSNDIIQWWLCTSVTFLFLSKDINCFGDKVGFLSSSVTMYLCTASLCKQQCSLRSTGLEVKWKVSPVVHDSFLEHLVISLKISLPPSCCWVLKHWDVQTSIINLDLLLAEAKKPLPFKVRVVFLNDIIDNILLIILPGVLDAIFNEA